MADGKSNPIVRSRSILLRFALQWKIVGEVVAEVDIGEHLVAVRAEEAEVWGLSTIQLEHQLRLSSLL